MNAPPVDERPGPRGWWRGVPLAHPSTRRGLPAVSAVVCMLAAGLCVVRAGTWGELDGVERVAALVWLTTLYAVAVAPAWLHSARARGAWRRLGKDRAFTAGAAVLLVMVTTAVLAPLMSTEDPTRVESPSTTRYEAPGVGHPMGTDRFGRDVWSRVAHGGRVSFGVCAISVLLAMGLGILVGSVSGMAPRRIDDVIMRGVDGLLAFPRLLLMMTAVALIPPGAVGLALLIGATSWMGMARLVRGEVRRMRGREFVEAAVATGVSYPAIVLRHLLPNTLGHVIVAATLNAGTVLLLESSLSFLGLGVQPPDPSWGSMVNDGRDALATAWWVSACPAAAITAAVVALNLTGDAMRDALDPRAPLR